jgi:cell division protein FtsQ
VEIKKRYRLINILITSLWVLVAAATIALLVAGMQKKDEKKCKAINIKIKDIQKNYFIDEKDIISVLVATAGGNPVGKTTGSVDLKIMEEGLKKNIWISNAQLYFDNNETLQVNIAEREPLARIFTLSGSTFYIDDSLMRLPLSDKFSARLPVFTGFPGENGILSKEDSNLLGEIKNMSLAIRKDPFLSALIEQVEITAQRYFEMIPKIGNQVIVFGDASNMQQKFNNLVLFYKKIASRSGIGYYSTINLQYKGQVVAKRRGADDITADSIRTLQIMQMVAANAEKRSGDSLQAMMEDNSSNIVDSSIIQQSIQREEGLENAGADVKETLASEKKPNENIKKDAAAKPLKPATVIAKPVIVKPFAKQQQQSKPNTPKPPVIKKGQEKPKALMPVNNN